MAITRLPIVLVIDDNPADLDLITIAFEESGIAAEVRTELDGERALARLAAAAGDPDQRPQLVLIDLNMPKVHGHELVRFIRSDPRLARTFVAVLTTSSAARDRDQALHLGADRFIVKPPTFAELKDVVESLRGAIEAPVN
jgi:CheY-like chemotaxis protein